jgi:gamma-glutamylcyclotransferase (GGCT)/AIG2-like uncharacterized protein YtfP
LAKSGSLLFVYGTLRPFMNIPMARWLNSVAEHACVARAGGRLYDLGRYPGLVSARAAREWVIGDVYRLPSPLRILRALDRYEGGPDWRGEPQFVRVERTVWVEPRAVAAAWLYLYQRPIVNRPRVASGDYRVHLASKRGIDSSPQP